MDSYWQVLISFIMTDSANPFILNLSTLYVMFFLKTPFNKIKDSKGLIWKNSLQLIKSMYCCTAQSSIYQETKQQVNCQVCIYLYQITAISIKTTWIAYAWYYFAFGFLNLHCCHSISYYNNNGHELNHSYKWFAKCRTAFS